MLLINILNNYKTIFAFLVLFSFSLSVSTSSALSNTMKNKAWYNLQLQKQFPINNNKNNTSYDTTGIQLVKKFDNLVANLTLNLEHRKNLTFDQSFIEYNKKNMIFGLGKINRNWSFSPYNSLILSSNARPSDSIYFQYKNSLNSYNISKSWMKPWSFDIFNSVLSNQDSLYKPMLLGMRVIIEPTTNLKLELIKTSQWGGEGEKDFSAMKSAIIGDTNEGESSNINQMAGFGILYKSSSQAIPKKLYAQFIGEDEAGNFPSCFISLIGSEIEFMNNDFLSSVNLEYIDTRVDTSTNGNCGPNTAYNNYVYDYTNYGVSLGAPIDTESKSISMRISTEISQELSIDYSIKNLVINDTNWSNHRVSSSKKNGWISSIATSWKFNSIEISSSLSYQSFSLDKSNLKNGFNLSFSTEYIF